MIAGLAKRMSRQQQQMLLEHIALPKEMLPVVRGRNSSTRRFLIEIGLLMWCHPSGRGSFHMNVSGRSKFTRLTARGREVAAFLLAQDAERLVALGCHEPDADPIATAPSLPAAIDNERKSQNVGENEKAAGPDRPVRRVENPGAANDGRHVSADVERSSRPQLPAGAEV